MVHAGQQILNTNRLLPYEGVLENPCFRGSRLPENPEFQKSGNLGNQDASGVTTPSRVLQANPEIQKSGNRKIQKSRNPEI